MAWGWVGIICSVLVLVQIIALEGRNSTIFVLQQGSKHAPSMRCGHVLRLPWEVWYCDRNHKLKHDLSGLRNQIISSSEHKHLGVTPLLFHSLTVSPLPFIRALQRPTPQSTAHSQLCLVVSSFLLIETDCPQTSRCYWQTSMNLVKIFHTFSYEVRMWKFKRLVIFPILV